MEKFKDCAALVLTEAQIIEVFTLVESLDKCEDISMLVNSLLPSSEGSS
jgi:hypothetical protein